jgi:hypothetical protein
MKPILIKLLLFLFVGVAASSAQVTPFEREFDHPIDDVKQALQALKADGTARLPTLRGFVTDNLALGSYERPYYQFETEIVPRDGERTVLRVKARITAWYSDPAHRSEEYRSLTSTGRLEWEFLDRVNSYLAKADSDLDGRISTLNKMLADIQLKTQELQKKWEELTSENKVLESALQTQGEPVRLVTPMKPGITIFDHPGSGAHAVTAAQHEDVFEVVGERPGWFEVKLSANTTGFIAANLVKPATIGNQSSIRNTLDEKLKPFVVTREAVTPFLGEWASLKGKKALFMWAQPVGLLHRDSREKLGYIEQTFADRYRNAVHSDIDYSGLVIIFIGTDNKSGVAAARLDDIGAWLDGHMPESEFLKRCSLDPPEVFRGVRK